jgi:hypothetical protein
VTSIFVGLIADNHNFSTLVHCHVKPASQMRSAKNSLTKLAYSPERDQSLLADDAFERMSGTFRPCLSLAEQLRASLRVAKSGGDGREWTYKRFIEFQNPQLQPLCLGWDIRKVRQAIVARSAISIGSPQIIQGDHCAAYSTPDGETVI